jgi:hypothetical protein
MGSSKKPPLLRRLAGGEIALGAGTWGWGVGGGRGRVWELVDPRQREFRSVGSPVSTSTPFAVASVPELLTTTAHLRTVLGDEDYESLVHKGETMSTAEIAAYAYDQIDQARAVLTAVSK